jgi:hypothetical protein
MAAVALGGLPLLATFIVVFFGGLFVGLFTSY